MNEIEEIRQFIVGFRLGDAIPAMEEDLQKSIGYSQRIGELLNDAEHDYRLLFAEKLDELKSMEEETETTRKAKLEAWTADARRTWQNFRTINGSLRAIRMSLMQAIKTRRNEMEMR